MRKVLVFGVFDGLHSGHIRFLKQAKKIKDSRLIVAIAPDNVVKKLKNRKPNANEKERLELVKSLRVVDQAVVGDRELSSYNIVKKINPDVVCLGYDQYKLAKDIKKQLPKIKIMFAKAYEGKKLHSSKIRLA